ncbi:MAG: XrtA/PEP-CTERM system histidine kinase PrsK [Novosphingobium sp.]
MSSTWSAIDLALWSAGAIACLLGAVGLETGKRRYDSARRPLAVALALTGCWGLTGAALGTGTAATAAAESLRNLGWLFALYRLFAIDGRIDQMKPVRPMLGALAFVESLHLGSTMLLVVRGGANNIAEFHGLASLHVLAAIGALVLVHNLYGGASPRARLALRWPAAALALLWAVDLNHFAIALLTGSSPEVTGALRGLLGVAISGLIALGAREDSENLRFSPSRAVTFQSISILLIGVYLVMMVAVAQSLAMTGSDFAVWLQLGFVATASFIALALATSSRLRGWLRVTVLKHLFQHRYDYRAEWLRLTRTMGQDGADADPLHQRTIRALADITESPAGLLLIPGDVGQLELAASWQWPTVQVPAEAMDAFAVRSFEQSEYVADLDHLRREPSREVAVPDWLLAEPRAWALVPLLHFERTVGMVVLARPAHVRRLDWEDFDLLRVAGRQLASYLAENAGQAALAEAARFDDFHRRIAFVMHDIKNLASQMGLLARNAEMHADNPEFRADMLVTLRNSTDKLNALLARLSRYGSAAIDALTPVRADEVARAVVMQVQERHPVMLIEEHACVVAAARDSLEQVLLHLVQNAIDASPADSPVFVSVSSDGLSGIIEVIDSGAGMSPEFVRTRLFKPFDSTKSGGFGIGAYEARELVRAMRGRMEVESREDLGTRFLIRLPMAEAAALLDTINEAGETGKKVA